MYNSRPELNLDLLWSRFYFRFRLLVSDPVDQSVQLAYRPQPTRLQLPLLTMPSPTLTLPAALVSLPPATRALTGVLIAFSSLLFVLRLSIDPRDIKAILGASGDNTLLFPWLLLLPGKVAYYPWTLITASAVETNLIEVSLFMRPVELQRRVVTSNAPADDALLPRSA